MPRFVPAALLSALFALTPALTPALHAQAPAAKPRVVTQFTTGWKFLQSDAAGAQAASFNDASWKPVTLPHDWAIAGPVSADAPTRGAGGFAPSGIGWYRKTFTVPASDLTSTRRTFIVFDGVMANSDVYLNGELLGHRPYGYVSFVYELTPHLKAGSNVIAVKVDNSDQPASRWYPGAGINRQVRLITTGSTHIVPWGTFVTTPSVDPASATVHIRTTVTNQSSADARLTLSVQLTGPGTAPHFTATKSTPATAATTVAPNATADLNEEITVPRPDRWDLDHPVLYSAHVTLLRDGKPVDEETVPFGIREFHFDADQGFFLNGKHHKVYGVALHTDGGAVGTAVPLGVWERRLTELRKLGVNAIRTAHNPPAPEFLDLADRMGFLVMDEMFDCWTVGKNKFDYHLYFNEWSDRDLTDTVMRDRNHPSIILWSAGNEIHDTPKPEIAIPILKRLVADFHAADSTRPVTQALFRPNASHDYEDGLADLLDVVGQNYREQEILKAHADKPTRKIIGTENAHDRNQWVAMRDHPEYSGQFLWAGIDYLGESGFWPTIGAGSGLLMSDAIVRPRGLERQSWWSDKPMVAVVRSVVARRATPIDPGYANATSTSQAADAQPAPRPSTVTGALGTRPAGAPPIGDPSVRFFQPLLHDWTPTNLQPHNERLEVYTNADEVELFLNGKSLGTKQKNADANAITFNDVPFAPGTLRAEARTAGKVVASDELKTAGPAAKLVLEADFANHPITPDWNDVRYVTATLEDASGNRIPNSETRVKFTVSGPAQVIGTDSGNMQDHDSFLAPDRRVYDGNVTALVRATGISGPVKITASADGIAPATVILTTAPTTKEDSNLIETPSSRSF